MRWKRIIFDFDGTLFDTGDGIVHGVRLGQDMERDGFLKPQRVAETIRT